MIPARDGEIRCLSSFFSQKLSRMSDLFLLSRQKRMSIEFHCSECYAKVITPDETGGKQGKCPYCTAIIHIPERNPAAVVPQPVQTNPVVAPHSQPVIQQGQPVPQQGPAPPSTLNDPFKPTGDKTAQPKDVLVEKQL